MLAVINPERKRHATHHRVHDREVIAGAVEFYNKRFNVGFTDQERADLVAFLEAL
jgi:hypothetical protein